MYFGGMAEVLICIKIGRIRSFRRGVWHEGSRLSGTKMQDPFFGIKYPPYRARDWKEDMGPIDIDFSQGNQRWGFKGVEIK